MNRRLPRWAARLLAPGPLYVAIVALAVTIIAVCTINAAARYGEKFPGFFVWENFFVPAVGEPTWTGVRSGLRYHSWLLEADGNSLGSPDELHAIVEHRQIGEPIHYVLEKDGERYAIDVPVMRLDGRPWSAVLGIYLFDALILLGLGLIVLYMKPDDAAAKALFLFCADLALYIATSADVFGPYVFRVPYFYFINLLPASICWLLSHFPVGRRRHALETPLIAGVAALGLAHGTVSNWAFHRNHALLLTSEALTHTFMAVAGAGALAFYTWHFLRPRSRLARERTKVVLFGSAGAFTLPVVMLLAVYLWGLSFPFNLMTVFFVLFPISIGYAIAKHDLFDIDRTIKRTLVYGVLSTFILAVYMSGITLIDAMFEAAVVASRIAEGILILFLILITTPSRARIQAFVDRVYDRRRYDYRQAVRSVAKSFSSILDFHELVRTALRLVDETVQPHFVEIYTIDDDGTATLAGRIDHEIAGVPCMTIVDETSRRTAIEALGAALGTRDVYVADPGAGDGEVHPAALASLLAQEGTLVLPMRIEDRPVAAMVVGPRRAGGVHSADDADLLRTLCDQLAVALENARAYRKIDLLYRGLEQKNIELEDANRILRETQEELIRQERLAAIGQVSAAVAHAIRNPLAGIRAAAQLALLEHEDEEDTAALHDIVAETDRLNERISALLEFSRPFEPALRRTDMSVVVESAIRATEGKAHASDVRLAYEPAGALAEVELDPLLFEQVIVELVANAVDVSPKRGAVTITTGMADGEVWVEVRDSGPGIPQDKLGRIFDLFFTTKKKGTGFGLATVKKIVERHGGRVEVANAKGGGACFRVFVPAAAAEARASA